MIVCFCKKVRLHFLIKQSVSACIRVKTYREPQLTHVENHRHCAYGVCVFNFHSPSYHLDFDLVQCYAEVLFAQKMLRRRSVQTRQVHRFLRE